MWASRLRHPSALAFSVGTLALISGARADDSDHCRRVRAQASAEAAILEAPRVLVQGIRFPSSARVDLGPTVGDDLQARAGLTLSPVDMYRGVLVRRMADAECHEHERAAALEDVMSDATDGARLEALQAQLAYLDEQRGDWQALVDQAAERLQARAITVVEFRELQRLAQALELKRAQASGEIERLRARGVAAAAGVAAATAESYASATVEAERALVKIRATDAWTFRLTGGVIPLPGRPLDWFGLAELTYSLGGPWQSAALVSVAQAREAEVRRDRAELPARLERAQAEARAMARQAAAELRAIQADLASGRATEAALERSDAPGAAQAQAALRFERIATEAQERYLRTLRDRLSAMGSDHGS